MNTRSLYSTEGRVDEIIHALIPEAELSHDDSVSSAEHLLLDPGDD